MNHVSAAEESVLADLVSLWQRRRAEGQAIAPAELCRDRPELLPELEQRIAALERMNDLALDGQETVTLATAASPPVNSAPGRWPEIPGYEIVGELGRGGMGVVYKARQTQLGRLVALKMILSGGHAGDAELARFRTEAEAIARLQHGNIVQIYEVGEHDGRPFFSLEFCAGGSLEQKLNGTPLPAQEAARLIETLAQAMQAAHQAHVIHRDLKPANVLLTTDGTPKITDFGLAKKLDGEGQTHTGAVMGTPSYMAPEQAGGQKDIGPAADVYALGAMLYELLTGRPPFKAATVLDTIVQVKNDEPVPPRRLQSKLPRDLETICLKCLQKQPSRRYASAAALAEDLRRFHAGEPIAARPVGRWERGWRWCRRNPMAAGLSAALLLLLIAVAAGSSAAAIHLNRTTKEARQNAELADEARRLEEADRKIAEAQKEEAKKQKEIARFYQYMGAMYMVPREYEANNIGYVRELLDAQVPRDRDETDFRGFEWYYWQRLAHQEVLTLKGHLGSVVCVSFSPDGRVLASGGDSTVRIWDAATGKELRTLRGHGTNVFDLSFSPDGRWLASAGLDGTIRVWEAATGKELRVIKAHKCHCVAFRPDGQRLASADVPTRSVGRGDSAPTDGNIRVWDAATGKELLTIKGLNGDVTSVSFSPDGRQLASAGFGKVRLWDAATGKELFTLEGQNSRSLDKSFSFSPDGRRLATGDVRGTVRIWDVASRKVLRTIEGHTAQVDSVSFSPDGQRLASASGDRTVRVWDAATGKQLLVLNGHTDRVSRVCFSADGRRLASAGADNTVRVWDASEKVCLTIKGHTGLVHGIAFSPDGQRLASASGDKTVRVWDAVTGNPQLTLQLHSGVGRSFLSGRSVSFSPDNRLLAAVNPDHTVQLWDAATGKELHTLKGHADAVKGVSFSPDGRRLASASFDHTVLLWDAATGKQLLTIKESLPPTAPHATGFYSVSFSPDGRRLATAGALGTIRLWDAVTGEELLTLKRSMSWVNAVSFSPDGRRLASAGSDRTVRIWDADTGKKLLTLKGHTGHVFDVTFSPDGSRLASTGSDKMVRVWETTTGKELLALNAGSMLGQCVSFSPDGKRLAAPGSDRTVLVWDGTEVPDAVWRQRKLASRVDSLFEELGFREEVEAVLRSDPTLSEADRENALRVTQAHAESAAQLSHLAWEAIAIHDASKNPYARALRQAEAAVRLAPDKGVYLSTLGMVQYRAGRYADALTTLTKSEKLNATKEGSHPLDLTFLAMTLHHLGKKDEAKATLDRLRKAMQQPHWAILSPGFLHEAEELIEGKAGIKIAR